MGLITFLFPGQGSQQPGMGKALYDQSPAARALLDRAEALMPGLLAACFEGPMERLTRTDTAQPALFAVSLATAEAAKEAGLIPRAAAGFSLGEWSAVRFAGMLDFDSAFKLVMKRGQWMQECAQRSPGGMAAVLRLGRDELLSLLKEYPGVWPVNFNTPEQTVVAAREADLDSFLDAMKTQGVRCLRLNVSGAFHSPLMQEASRELAEALAVTDLQTPGMPVYSNVSGLPYDLADARQLLSKQASSPVKWTDTIKNLAAAGFDTFLELGPGRVLSGLVSKIVPGVRALQAEDVEGIHLAAGQIGAMT